MGVRSRVLTIVVGGCVCVGWGVGDQKPTPVTPAGIFQKHGFQIWRLREFSELVNFPSTLHMPTCHCAFKGCGASTKVFRGDAQLGSRKMDLRSSHGMSCQCGNGNYQWEVLSRSHAPARNDLVGSLHGGSS